MSPLEIPLYDMCQGGNGTPEWTLRHVIRFITTVGVESDSFFQEVFGSLRAILTVPDPAALYISEELQCLALRGITAMILGVCYRDSQGAAQGHVPLHPVYAYHTGQAPSRFDPVHAALDAALAGIEGREWRTPAGTDPSRADRAAKFSYGQLPLSEIRQRPRKMRWQRLELTNAVAEVVYVIEALLHESDELKAFPDLGSERPDKQQQQQSKVIVFTQLQLEAVYSLVLLSDLLSDDHIAWMQDLFARFFGALAAPSTPDPVLMGNLAYGVLKCVAMTGASTPAAAKLVAYVVKYSLEAENAAISIGALAGMRLLLLLLLHHADAGTPKLLLLPPHLVGLATRHILAELGRPSPCSEQSVLHLLASGFSLIRAFPSETELSGFSDGLVKAVCALVAVEDCSPVVSCAAYLGLSTLLAEASLPARTQGSLEAFALKALRALPPHAASSERGLTLLGILLSAVYHSPAARPAAELDKAIRALFGLARKGFFACRCVEAFVEGVARIVMDRLAPEVAVSLAVSELSKAKTSAWVTGLVVGRVFSLVEDRGVLATVTAASLRGILTCEAPYKVWMATCLLLAALPGEPPSPSASSASSSCSSSSSHYFSLLRATLCDTLASCKEDYALFAVAAAAFIESYPELTKEAKDNVVAALGHLGAKVPSYKMMISKLK